MGRLCDVLAGVPSIVVGILGYELLVVPLGHFNGWAGALWRMLSEEMAGPATPHRDTELDEVGDGG